MTVDFEVLIALLGLVGGFFGVILRYVIKNDRRMTELTTAFKALVEHDRVEMQRLNTRVDKVEDEVKDHGDRIGRLEANIKYNAGGMMKE